jgi:hypothetical protein
MQKIFENIEIEDRGYDKGVCWIWKKALDSNGYGMTSVGGKLIRLHRLSFTEFRGTIPAGWTIDHLCRIRDCCNPNHLETVTRRINNLRGNGFSGRHARKTHCEPEGHPLSGDNLYITPDGRRNCKECRRRQQREGYARKKAASAS